MLGICKKCKNNVAFTRHEGKLGYPETTLLYYVECADCGAQTRKNIIKDLVIKDWNDNYALSSEEVEELRNSEKPMTDGEVLRAILDEIREMNEKLDRIDR